MIEIVRTYDVDYIRRCVTHRSQWRHVSDDGCGDPALFFPDTGERLYWLKPTEIYGDEYGVFLVHAHNSICYEVHTCLLPVIWGRSLECTKALIEWVFDFTDCLRLITSVPENNILALNLAKESGLDIFGVNRKSFLKNGKLLDQIMLGISKGGN